MAVGFPSLHAPWVGSILAPTVGFQSMPWFGPGGRSSRPFGSRPGDGDASLTLRVEYTTIFIPGAIDLGAFCEVDIDCGCTPDLPIGGGVGPYSGTGGSSCGVSWAYNGEVTEFDPNVVPFWFYQYIIDNYTGLAGFPYGGAALQLVRAATCVVAAGELGPDPSDPLTWDGAYCANATFADWEAIARKWAELGPSLTSTYQASVSADPNEWANVSYIRVRFPNGTRILEQRCEEVTYGDPTCPACN